MQYLYSLPAMFMLILSLFIPSAGDVLPAAEPNAHCTVQVARYTTPAQSTEPGFILLSRFKASNYSPFDCDYSYLVESTVLGAVQPYSPTANCSTTSNGIRCSGTLTAGEIAEIDYLASAQRLRDLGGIAPAADRFFDGTVFHWVYYWAQQYLPFIDV